MSELISLPYWAWSVQQQQPPPQHKSIPMAINQNRGQQQKEVYVNKVHISKLHQILQISDLVPEPFLPESEAALSPKSDKTQQHIKTPQSEELE